MGQPRRNWACRLAKSKACGRTTGPRIRICRCDDASGRCSVLNHGAALATLELVHSGTGVAIGQVRGACNAKAPKEVLRAVNSWLRAQKEFRFPQKRPDLLDDELPF